MEKGQINELDTLRTILQIFIIVVIPVAIGMIIRRFKFKFATRMAKPIRIVSGLLLALIIVGMVLKEKDNFLSYFKQAGIAALMLNLIMMFVGLNSARIFRSHYRQATSISIESGIQNGTLAMTIAVVLLKNSAFGIAPGGYSLLIFFTGGLAIFLSNRLISSNT